MHNTAQYCAEPLCTVLHCPTLHVLNPSTIHYPIFKSDVHGFNCSSTSHFTKGILWDRHRFSRSRCSRVSIPQYQPVPSLRMVLADTNPRACTVEYTLLNFCSENVLTTWSFADKLRQELLSGWIRLGPMWCPTILLPFKTKIKIWQTYINWSAQHFKSFIYSARCSSYHLEVMTVQSFSH